MGTQVQIAHKNARFLKLYYESYRNYEPDEWYYSAGQYPTKSILYKQPDLVHRVKDEFGVNMKFAGDLYLNNTDIWRTCCYTIHLLFNRRYYLDEDAPITQFDEYNIRNYNFTFGDMARDIMSRFNSTSVYLD